MLKHFFKLDEPYDEFKEVVDLEQHFEDPAVSLLENVKFLPTKVEEISGKLFKEKKFKNVSFSFTRFENLTFSGTRFEDCLFLYADFTHCHFFNCQFINCNMHKIRLDNCFLDPLSFEMDEIYKTTASNVGTWLYQQLFLNSKNTHQSQFSGDSEILFKRWLRAQKAYEFSKKELTGFNFLFDGSKLVFWWLIHFLTEYIIGYGHKPLRFFGFSFIILLVVSLGIHLFWGCLGLEYNYKPLIQENFLTSLYYTTVVTTTLGFGDITPTTDCGKYVAIILSILGTIWFGILAAVFVKRLGR